MSQITTWPRFFPTTTDRITSRSARVFIGRYRQETVYVPSLKRNVLTAYVPPVEKRNSSLPVCFLHGFDSSSLDFRDLVPYVESRCETWAVDLVGWGFSGHDLYFDDPSLECSPAIKRDHLFQFWKEFIGRPMCLMGASLGGAVAMDFCLNYPEAVDRLVLFSSQGYNDGLGLLSKLPTFVARWGVQLLGTKALRRNATRMSYFDKTLDFEQRMTIARLHTLLPGVLWKDSFRTRLFLGWMESCLAFIRSDGYSIRQKIPEIEQPTLILWGREDKILGTEAAQRFQNDIPNSRLEWIEACGHAGFIENHQEIGDALLRFIEE